MTLIENFFKKGIRLDFESQEEIDIGCENITNFDDLCRFKNLNTFIAYRTSFDSLTHLEGFNILYLDISETKVRSLHGLSRFKNLYWLDISGIYLNDERTLLEILQLKNLEWLMMSSKDLKKLPSKILSMPKLEWVNGHELNQAKKTFLYKTCIKHMLA